MIAVANTMITVARAWQWGMVALADSDPAALLPDEIDPEEPVTLGNGALIALIRHAQDVDADAGYTHAIAVIRRWDGALVPDPDGAHVVFDGVIDTPSGAVEVGDADEWVRLPAFAPQTRVTVSHADDADGRAPNAVVFDLFPSPQE